MYPLNQQSQFRPVWGTGAGAGGVGVVGAAPIVKISVIHVHVQH